MKTPLALVALLAASSAVAQTAPSVSKKSPNQHSVEIAYATASSQQVGLDDLAGVNASARAYVWQNVFLTLQYFDVGGDVTIPAVTTLDLSRFGYGIGASFQVGPGKLDVSYTQGKIEIEAPGVIPPGAEIDQGRLSATYSHAYSNGVTAALGVTQFFNDEGFGWDDATAFTLTVGYDFRNGLSVFATYSPDSDIVGDDDFAENTFSIGAKYSF